MLVSVSQRSVHLQKAHVVRPKDCPDRPFRGQLAWQGVVAAEKVEGDLADVRIGAWRSSDCVAECQGAAITCVRAPRRKDERAHLLSAGLAIFSKAQLRDANGQRR